MFLTMAPLLFGNRCDPRSRLAVVMGTVPQ